MINREEDFEDMEIFGKERQERLRQSFELPDEISDNDTFRRVFERVIPKELRAWLNNWLGTEVKAYFDDLPRNSEETARSTHLVSPVEKGQSL